MTRTLLNAIAGIAITLPIASARAQNPLAEGFGMTMRIYGALESVMDGSWDICCCAAYEMIDTENGPGLEDRSPWSVAVATVRDDISDHRKVQPAGPADERPRGQVCAEDQVLCRERRHQPGEGP